MRRTISGVERVCERPCVDVDCESDCDGRGSRSAGRATAVTVPAVLFEGPVAGAAELFDVRCGRDEVELERRCCDIVKREVRWAKSALVAACCR